MGVDVKEVVHEASNFFRFDLRRRGFVIEARPAEEGWEVEAELLDPRPDLSTSYKKVYDQNIYLFRVGNDLKILSCEKIGTRETTGEIRLFPRTTRVLRPISPKHPPRAKESAPEKKFSLDPSVVGNLADEISKRVSSVLGRKGKVPSEDELLISKEAFIDPHQEADLDFNFARVGKLEREEEENLSEAVERLKEMSSKVEEKETGGSS